MLLNIVKFLYILLKTDLLSLLERFSIHKSNRQILAGEEKGSKCHKLLIDGVSVVRERVVLYSLCINLIRSIAVLIAALCCPSFVLVAIIII